MTSLYPAIEPYDSGLLDVGDGNRVHWEVCGNPDGIPALVVHGGPGSGCTPGNRVFFDPLRYRLVLFDQRGCGRSRPLACDPATDLSTNTTQHLIADMEALRSHLGIERWLLSGASWGVTLSLAYAQSHSRQVSAMVLTGVATTTRAEVDWLYRGLALFFPQEWDRFRAAVPGDDVIAGYVRVLGDPDPAVRMRAATEWHAWEDATISLEAGGRPGSYSARPPEQLLARARICSHYFSHNGFLADGALLAGMPALAGIPGVLIHGRVDMGSPLRVAWRLHQAWPGSELHIVDDSGHTGTASSEELKRETMDRLARSIT